MRRGTPCNMCSCIAAHARFLQMNTYSNNNTSHIDRNALEHAPRCSSKQPAWPPTWVDSATGRAAGGENRAAESADAPVSPPPPAAEVVAAKTTEPSSARRSPQPPATPDWPAELASFVLALTPGDLPPTPFQLTPWAKVLDSARYLVWLKRDIVMGSDSPRARYGALQTDMRRLLDVVNRYSEERKRSQ